MKLYELLLFIIGLVAISAGGCRLGKYIASEDTKPNCIKIEEQRSTELETKQIDE